ncbi:hypothetical protein EV363DRAFT_1396025 [Boletus edulis]|nr:hypothetical protein EV363DRAFT_1396025 [Boletus edulis]
MDKHSSFQKKLVIYLEGCHIGSVDQMHSKLNEYEIHDDYCKPTETLPIPPSYQCLNPKFKTKWTHQYESVTDDILLHSNLHTCSGSSHHMKHTVSKSQPVLGCKSNKLGVCKARFPWPVLSQTLVDPLTGYLTLKKGEAMMNTFTYMLSYLFRCNTDAVVAYISDYISKSPLKTYTVFDTICGVFQKSANHTENTSDREEKARKLMTQIVNSLILKLEIGAPFSALYLLQHPDHYTSHKFISFYWASFVHEAHRIWHENDALIVDHNEPLVMRRSKELILCVSKIFDYIYQPRALEFVSPYDWISTYERVPLVGKGLKNKYLLHQTTNVKTILLFFFTWVPNFIGPSLPRADKGDSEFYCATMLTLLKHWCTGYDLKSESSTWNEAFNTTSFEAKHATVIQNFKVKYECMDPWDDFFFQRRDSARTMGFSSTVNIGIPEHIIYEVDESNTFEVDNELEPLITDIIGRKHIKWEYDKNVIEEILSNSSWLGDLFSLNASK